jgi:RNase adapter protein RapZ
LQALPQVLADVSARPAITSKILFFDAADEVSDCGGSARPAGRILWPGRIPIQEGIARERKALESIRALADKVIDTSDFNVHQLKREMEEQFCEAPISAPHGVCF